MCAALKNPEVVAKRGGLSTILKSVIDCQLSRINEALITTVLHLLNHPRTRQYVRVDIELEVRAHVHRPEENKQETSPVFPALLDLNPAVPCANLWFVSLI